MVKVDAHLAVIGLGTRASAFPVRNVAVAEPGASGPRQAGLPTGGKGGSLAGLALVLEASANSARACVASEGKLDQGIGYSPYALKLDLDHDYLPGRTNLLAALVGSGCWPEVLASGSVNSWMLLHGRFHLTSTVYQ